MKTVEILDPTCWKYELDLKCGTEIPAVKATISMKMVKMKLREGDKT